jgi:hypothetical protein
MNPLVQAALGSILRAVLAGLAGWFVNRGIWTADAANEYLTAAALAILTLGWALWTKYKDRIKFLTALEAPVGTSEAKVDKKVSEGLGAKLLLLFLVVALTVSTTACALKTPRHDVTVGVTVLTKSLGGLQDAVVIACNAAIIAPADCRKIGATFVKIWPIDADVVSAVRAWHPGAPMPQIIRAEIAEVRALIADLGLVPALADNVLAVYDAIATMLLIFLPGGGL